MDYAQYPPQGNHYQPQPAPGSAQMTSPNNHHNSQMHPQHQNHQASPILPTQNNQFQQPPNGQHMYNQAYGNFMSPSQAAAMATVAAAGPQYYMPPSSMAQQSPHLAQVNSVKQEQRQPRTPPAGQNQMPPLPSQVQPQHQMPPQRRMSQHIPGGVTSQPHVNSQPVAQMNHHPQPPRSSVPPQQNQMPPPSHAISQQQPTAPAPAHQSPEPAPAPGAAEESPLYVNAKQFHRILKRRVARQRLEEALRLTSKGRRPYLHESRHKHAMRRPRGPGGRFLTADEVADMEKKGELTLDGEDKENEVVGQVQGKGKGTKRKSMGGGEPGGKKRKGSSEEDESEGDEDDD